MNLDRLGRDRRFVDPIFSPGRDGVFDAFVSRPQRGKQHACPTSDSEMRQDGLSKLQKALANFTSLHLIDSVIDGTDAGDISMRFHPRICILETGDNGT